jgi:hypothetical protein
MPFRCRPVDSNVITRRVLPHRKTWPPALKLFCLAARPERSAVLISGLSNNPLFTKRQRRDINRDSAKTEIWSESFPATCNQCVETALHLCAARSIVSSASSYMSRRVRKGAKMPHMRDTFAARRFKISCVAPAMLPEPQGSMDSELPLGFQATSLLLGVLKCARSNGDSHP